MSNFNPIILIKHRKRPASKASEEKNPQKILETPHLLAALEHGLTTERLPWEFLTPWRYRIQGKNRTLYADLSGDGVRLTLDGHVRDFQENTEGLKTTIDRCFAKEIAEYKSQAIDEIALFLDHLGQELNLPPSEDLPVSLHGIPHAELLYKRLPAMLLADYTGITPLGRVQLAAAENKTEEPVLVVEISLPAPAITGRSKWPSQDLKTLKELTFSALDSLCKSIDPEWHQPCYVCFKQVDKNEAVR